MAGRKGLLELKDGAVEAVGGLLKHPLFAVALTLLLAALAAAGFNTLALARLLLVGLFLTIAFATFTVRRARLSITARVVIVVGALMVCLLIDRVLHAHAEAQEAAGKATGRAMPRPPLMLMFRPREMFERQTFTPLKEQALAIGYASFPEGGYPGFTLDNATDDVMLGIARFSISNLSDRPRQFRLSLHVVGEGKDFTLSNDGRGRWQRVLNVNDFLAKQEDTGGGRLAWGLSPFKLPPKRPVEASLGFVAPRADDALRGIIIGGGIDERYEVTLEFEEMPSGARFSLKLPLGNKPVVDQVLKARVEAAAERQGVARRAAR